MIGPGEYWLSFGNSLSEIAECWGWRAKPACCLNHLGEGVEPIGDRFGFFAVLQAGG
jgi:hypothetical protein